MFSFKTILIFSFFLFVFTFLFLSPAQANLNLVGDISNEETALGMVEYKDNLYIATHTNPKNDGPGTIIKYNDSTGKSEVAYKIPVGQGLGDIQVINGKVWVTSIDSGSSVGEIYVFDGTSWRQVTFGTVTGLLDIASFQNRYYVAGYAGRTPKLYSSSDGLTGWTEVYTYGSNNRFSQMTIFNGKLFFTPQTSNEGGPMYFEKDIFSYDGQNFTPIEFSSQPMQISDMEVFNNALYLSVWNAANVPGMYRSSDGVNFSPVDSFKPKLLDLLVYNGKLYTAEYQTGTPSAVIIYQSTNGTDWKKVVSVPATPSVSGSSIEYLWYDHAALGIYHGKLYIVPPAEGKLYILDPGSSPSVNSSPTNTLIPTTSFTPESTQGTEIVPKILDLTPPTPEKISFIQRLMEILRSFMAWLGGLI